MKAVLLALGVVVSAACTSVSHEQRVFEPASSLEERASAAQKNRLGVMATHPDVSTSAQSENAISSAKNPQQYREELIAAGLKALEEGNIARALERSYVLWHALDVERSRSVETDLKKPLFRDPALLLALAQAESSHGSDTALAERIVRANPQWEPAYVVLTNIYLKRNSYRLADKVVRTGFDRIENPSPTMVSLRVKVLYALSDLHEAMSVVERGLSQYPNSQRLVQWKGMLEFSLGHIDNACSLFAKAYADGKADAALAHNHAVCLTQSGQLEEALGVLGSVMLDNPQSAPLRLLAGSVLKKLGNYGEARSAWRDYLDLSDVNDPQREMVAAALNSLDSQGGSDLQTAKPLVPR